MERVGSLPSIEERPKEVEKEKLLVIGNDCIVSKQLASRKSINERATE